MREKYFVQGRLDLKQPRQDKNLFHRHDKPNELTKEKPLSFVLFDSPLTSVSTVSRGHPSPVFLLSPNLRRKNSNFYSISNPHGIRNFYD
jgi:hypothetical protein